MLFDDDKKNRPPRQEVENDSRNRDWRALDRKKDRSGHRDNDRQEAPAGERALRTDYQMERYKKQLEELFKGGKKPSPEQAAALKGIRQARGADIDKLCLKYLGQFGVPSEWDGLLLFLDASTAPVIKPALEKLAAIIKDETPTRQEMFKQRLRLLAMTTGDKELRKQAETLLASLPA